MMDQNSLGISYSRDVGDMVTSFSYRKSSPFVDLKQLAAA